MQRTLIVLSKRITIPKLSPTHTKSRIISFDIANGDEVIEYDPVFTVECSSDFITPAYRDSPDQKLKMIVETQEEGIVTDLRTDLIGKWLDVGSNLGIVDDKDPLDGDWTWQAYTIGEDEKK